MESQKIERSGLYAKADPKDYRLRLVWSRCRAIWTDFDDNELFYEIMTFVYDLGIMRWSDMQFVVTKSLKTLEKTLPNGLPNSSDLLKKGKVFLYIKKYDHKI